MFKVFLQPGDMLRCACFLGNFLPQWTYSLYVKKKTADIKANLFYGEKIQCNTGASMVSSWKSYVHKCSKHDKSL